MSLSFTPTELMVITRVISRLDRFNYQNLDPSRDFGFEWDEVDSNAVLVSRAYARFEKEFLNYRDASVKRGLLSVCREYRVLLRDAIHNFVQWEFEWTHSTGKTVDWSFPFRISTAWEIIPFSFSLKEDDHGTH